MTTRRRLLVGAIAAFAAALSVPKGSLASGSPKAAPLKVTYYFLPG